MQLDQITVNIRQRNPWEAIDLGFAMVRKFWRAIYLPWFIFLSIISALIFVIVPTEYKAYALIIVWWLKPLFDRFLLNSLSHQLFNEQLSSRQALQATPKLMQNTGLLSALTFRRLSLSRGFNLPIWQLEQLRGEPRAARQSTLLTNTHSHAIGLTLGMLFIEQTFYFSLYALIATLIPNFSDTAIVSLFIANNDLDEVPYKILLLDHIIHSFALFIVEPFYIAASFSLYLNRRTQLEAWDIELVFRQLAKRLQAVSKSVLPIVLLPLLIFLITSMSPTPAYASSDTQHSEHLSTQRLPAEQSASVIQEIMQRRELSNEYTSKTWVKLDQEKPVEKPSSFGSDLKEFFIPLTKIIAILFESSLWIALGAGLLVLFFTRHDWLHLFSYKKDKKGDYKAPEIMFGMDIRPQSLPKNITASARKLWQEHQHRAALSLLYRGALAQLVTIDRLALKSSQTEDDILRLVRPHLIPNRQRYLQLLTEQWKQIAYAHKLPQDHEVKHLFDHWESDFMKTTVKAGNRSSSANPAGTHHE